MSGKRIYDEVVEINSEKVQKFYDGRAEKASVSNPYASVLLSDHSPELIEEQVKIERDAIFQRLKLNSESNVLDIGCGIGRWAEKIIPVCKSYYGIDFSEKMVATAQERMALLGKDNYDIENMSFQQFASSDAHKNSPFNRVIISGVLVYVSDDDISSGIKNLLKFLDKECVFYVWEPCGTDRRLTLKDFYSDALQSDYSVIYRTKAEYNKLFSPLTDNGFQVSFCEYYSNLGGTVSYSDSDKLYYLLER